MGSREHGGGELASADRHEILMSWSWTMSGRLRRG
jgi:hypothetical protein